MGADYTGNPKARMYFGTIQGMTGQRASTAEVWAAVKASALAAAEWLEGCPPGSGAGVPAVQARAATALAGISVTDISQLRGIAGQMLRARQNLMDAPDDFPITAAMIGRPPNVVRRTNGPV